MALEYDLYLTASTKPRQALESLADHVDGLAWSEDNSWLFNEVVTITASESHSRTRSLFAETFHFTPTLGVGFRFAYDTDYDADYARFKQIMFQSTMLLLEHAQDAVLLFNGETIVLQRFGGKLVFNSDYNIFDDDDWLKSKLSLPFERRSLPSPLM
jgi:hypothetical protein